MSSKALPHYSKIPKDLLPCPFCGKPARMTVGITGLVAVVCTDYNHCGAYVTFDNPVANANREMAPIYWNKRA